MVLQLAHDHQCIASVCDNTKGYCFRRAIVASSTPARAMLHARTIDPSGARNTSQPLSWSSDVNKYTLVGAASTAVSRTRFQHRRSRTQPRSTQRQQTLITLMASPDLISALNRALALSRVLKRTPGAASTRRNAEGALAELKAAVAADPVSMLPDPQLGTLQQLLKSGDSAQVTLAARALLVLVQPGACSPHSCPTLCQVRTRPGQSH
jgi:hypothetical protein